MPVHPFNRVLADDPDKLRTRLGYRLTDMHRRKALVPV